jgi:16S rRNA (cytidine1402-2'-O)-methyltransferase
LLSVAGLEGDWLFHGFLPAKPGERRRALEALRDQPCALVFYEAPHRITETVADLAAVLGGERELVIGRELTKRFEQIHVGPLAEAMAWLAADSQRLRGEFVLVVQSPMARQDDASEEVAGMRLLSILLEELPMKQAVSISARFSGIRKNFLYEAGLRMKAGRDAINEEK